MTNLNVHLDPVLEKKFKELKLILDTKTNEETIEEIINIAFEEVRRRKTKQSSTTT